jgi:NADH-ubiquinone oxidoreductase chain 3
LVILGVSLGFKALSDREKSRPFECGFNPKHSARLPFSIRFFLVAIIFLVFDVELILLFPALPALSFSPIFPLRASLIRAIFILIVGLFHEIFQGSLALGAITIFIAGMSAIHEVDIKKIIALSTLRQLGLMFITLGIGRVYSGPPLIPQMLLAEFSRVTIKQFLKTFYTRVFVL